MKLIKKVIKHPDFKVTPGGGYANDIAIVKLRKPLKFKKNVVGNACLPNQSFEVPSFSAGIVSGWGNTKSGMYRKVASINKS